MTSAPSSSNDPVRLAAELPGPAEIAFFLDIDGTLIGPHHGDRANGISPARIDLLGDLSRLTGGATAFLTGREIDTVDRIFDPLRLPTGGLQGADRRFPDGAREGARLTREQRRLLEHLVEDVTGIHSHYEPEWKTGGIALVYPEHDPAADLVAAVVRAAVGHEFHVMRGRVAIDIVPPGANKGSCLTDFLAHPVFAGRKPVHLGDDVPDEPAFAAAAAASGFGITVGRPLASIDRHLADHEAVWDMLGAYVARHRG